MMGRGLLTRNTRRVLGTKSLICRISPRAPDGFFISWAPSQRHLVCWAQPLHCVRLFAAPWTVAGQAPGSGGHFLLQGIFPTQGSNPHVSYTSCVCRQALCHGHYLGSPKASGEETRFLTQTRAVFGHDPSVTPGCYFTVMYTYLRVLTSSVCLSPSVPSRG